MNEKALETLYSLAQNDGYAKSFEEFTALMGSNEDAVKQMYSLAQSDGYEKELEDFSTLVGYGEEKKNSESASDFPSEDLQDSTSDIVTDGETEVSDSDSTTDRFADNEVVRTNRTREVGSLLNERQRQGELAETKYDDFTSRKIYNEDLGEWEYTESSWDNVPVQFIQGQGAKSITDREADIQGSASYAAYFGVQEGKSKEEVIDKNFKATGIDQEIEKAFSEAIPEFEDNFFYTDEETGLQQVNPVALGKWSVQMDEVIAKEEEMLKTEMEILEDKSELGEIGYDMMTGLRGQANGILGLWNPEQAQYNLYADGIRTQASYKVEGLTDEDIEKGIFGNVMDGNMGAASTILGTQLAQTAPQLIIQALITKGAGAGFSAAGLSAKAAGSAAMWTSSAYMGASTFGTTSAQYYGLVDDKKRFAMALGDALVETLSERAFPDDMMALTKKTYKGVSMDAIRRDFFGVGVMSREFKRMGVEHLKRTGVQLLESGMEEGMEEMLAGIGSQWVHAAVNNEEFNMFEVIDGMIVGFGAGAKSRGVRALGETITATASSMGYGGFRNDLVRIKGAKQELASELAKTTDETRKAQIETKLKSLSKIELGIKAEMDAVYSEYSDEDAKATIEANQKAQHNINKAQDKSLDAETRKQARTEAKNALNTIKSIEAKYGESVANNKAEKEAVKNFDYGDTGSLEVGADTDAQGSRLVEGLKTIQKALGVVVKVHDSYDAMSKDMGVSIDEIAGTRGVHRASDGSIHIFLPAAQNNTSYHEAFHEIAMGIDPKLVNRFVEGAIAGMDEDLAEKYKDFGSQYEGSPEMMEEIFAELMADVTTGAISVEGAGASIASLAMAPVVKFLKSKGLYKGSTASFKEFATFVQSESNRLKTGESADADIKFSRKGQAKRAAEFAKQLANEAEMSKLPPMERMSPNELLGTSWNPESSSIWQSMPMNAEGNFVFAHTSSAELDNVDPRYFGKNIKTSKQERLEVGLAGVSVSMWGMSPAGIDISGTYMYQVEISPREVYNAVDDPEGFVDQARNQLKEQGKGQTANTVYALATKIASKNGYRMTVTPWNGNLKIQSVEKLDVTTYQEFERVRLYPNDTWINNEGTDVRSQVNAQAKRVLAKVKGNVTAALAERIRLMTYSALEGRFGSVANLQEWTELLQEADNQLDGALASEVASSMQIADTKGGSIRVIDAATRKKVIDNVMAKMAAKVDGFSIDPMTGEDMTEGTAVGDGKAEIEMDYDAASEVSRGLVEEVLNRVLRNPIAVVGGWFKPENSKFYLDSSEVYASQAVGERLGRKRKEFGVYNIKTGEFISTVDTEDRDGRDLKAQRISEVERMTELMNDMPASQVNWTEPTGTARVIVNPVEMNGQSIPDGALEALGYKSKEDLVKPTSYYNGIPSIPAMSDMLGSGQMKDANGNDMEANGGIGWGLWGRGLKDGAAWCGVTRHDAEVQLNDAINVYNANKSFFEKLWADGTLPNGHVPMFIMRMADTAINSNEAVLRHLAPYIQNFPKENRKAALVELNNKMQADFDWLTEKLERSEQGLPNMDKRTRTVKDPSKKQVGLTELEKNQFQAQKRLLNFIQENKFETLDDLLLAISENSKQRARAAVTKKDADSYLQLIDKEYLTSIMLRPHAETIDGYKAKSGSKPYMEALFGELEGDVEKFTFHSVMNGIAEPSMRQVKANHAVAVMGVDVLTPAVVKVGHENYGFGPRGRFISFLEDPQHGADIFPEWEVKLSRMARGGTSQTQSTVLSSVGSTFFGDKVFRGASVETELTDVKRVIAKMRHAFPHVHVSRDSAEFDAMIKSGEIEGKMSKKGVTIYGVSKGGRIFMNPTAESVDTAIHEFGHVWMDFLATGGGKQGKQILARGLELAKDTKLYKAKLEIYGDVTVAAEETLAELIAQKGVQIVEAAKASKFKSWMKGMYEFVTRNLKTIYARDGKDSMRMSKAERNEFIERLTLDDFTNLSIAELFQGKQVKSSYRPMDDGSAKARARADFKQKGVYKMVANAIKEGKKKSEIIQDLKEAGFTEKDARLMYEKAVGYNVGRNAGMRAGVKARNEAYKEKRKAELENERVEAKLLRQRAKEIFNREKKVTDAMIKEVADYLKDKKINIKPSQLKTILRLMSAAHRKLRGKTADTKRNYAVFLSFTDAVAKIIDKQMDAKQIEEHSKLLRKTVATQKALKARMKKMSPTSSNPLISYSREINDLVNVDAGVLSFEMLEQLNQVLIDLGNTAKAVGVKKDKDGNVVLGKPFVQVDGENVTLRRAKIYFNEVYADIKNEETQRTEQILIEQAMDMAYEEGTDWYTAYQELIRQKSEKNMAPMQKKLAEIAKEVDLDLENVDDLEAAFALYAEQREENEAEVFRVILEESVMPAIESNIELLVTSPDFQAILGYDPDKSQEDNMKNAEDRLKTLSLAEIKRLEFFMFDFVANGKTYGLNSLSAAVRAKTDGNQALRELDMKSTATKGPASAARKGYFGLFETTPTFFRRLFKQYSQAKLAKYMNAIGFGSIRKNVSKAEMIHELFVNRTREMLKERGLLDSKSQTRMQIYSVLRQKPEGMTDAAWVVYLKNSMKLALESDTRIENKQRAEIEEAMSVFQDGRRSRSLSEILDELSQDENLVYAVGQIEIDFLEQMPKIQEYAENFLGMHFVSQDNYLPMMFRAVGSKANSVEELMKTVENIGNAFGKHSLTKANSQASSTYERDANSLKSSKRYIDLNFLSAIEKTYKENEIKSATAADVAYISAITSERNEDFVNSVEDADDRARLRKSVYNYLVNASDYQQADEVLGKHGAKWANYAMNVTVVSFFGATIDQMVKQGSALLNAVFEVRSMGARVVYINAIASMAANKVGSDTKTAYEWLRLIQQYPIGRRDVISETLMVGEDAKIGEKTRFEKGVEMSTAALRNTDAVAATATWLAYYADYLISEEGMSPADIDWNEQAAKPNDDAAMYAEQMTTKDQNLNTRRDKSRINEIMRGQIGQLTKMFAMPFANFLFNKKLNLALDIQKVFIGDASNKKEAVRSLAGTAAEIAAFQAAGWMFLAPMYSALGSALFGADDEEESWWDENFGWKMFKRGMFLDMNPLVMPIAAVENYTIRGMNLIEYMLTEDSEDFTFADEEWSKGFERWEKLNGFPIFKGVGRGDLSAGGFFSMMGVTGTVAYDINLATKNVATLSGDKPYYTNTAGTKRYVSREDASKMALIESMRVAQYGVMMGTGLYSKELAKMSKAGKKPIERRSTQDFEQFIASEIMGGDSKRGVKDLMEYLMIEIEGDPSNATNKIDSIIRKAKSDQVNELVSGKNINTLRTIDKTEISNRGRAVFIHHIMETMDTDEASQFLLDSYIYFGVKYGVETVKSQMLADILKFKKDE